MPASQNDLLNGLKERSESLVRYLQHDAFHQPIPSSISAQHSLAIDPIITERLSSLRQSGRVIKDVVEELSLALAAIKSRYVSLKQMLNPVNMLPTEVLERVFLLGFYDIEHLPSRPCYARTISSVCQRWRSIGLLQRDLWTTILLNASESSIRLAVDRASRRQFDVTHSSIMEHSVDCPQTWISVSSVCPPERWRSLDVGFRHLSTTWKMFKKISPRLEGLKRLTIDAYPSPKGNMTYYRELEANLCASDLFPNLESLYIIWLPDITFRTCLSPTLVDLRLTIPINDDDLREIFMECTSLRQLWLSSRRIVNADETTYDSASIPDSESDDEAEAGNYIGEGFVNYDHLSKDWNFEYPTIPLETSTLESLILDQDLDVGFTAHIIEQLDAPKLKRFAVLLDPYDERMCSISSRCVYQFVSDSAVCSSDLLISS